MKKLYFYLLTIIIGGGLSYFLFIHSDSDNSLFNRNLISKDNQGINYSHEESKEADKPDEFTKYFKAITTKFGEDKNNYPLNYRVKELNNAKAKAKKNGNKSSSIEWNQRGPANVGGRTRGIIIDPDVATNNTWYAGAASGGIWKTEDRGKTWICLTNDLPNLSTNTLEMAASDHNIIYAGTGESFPGGTFIQGSGIFKSIDRGDTWTQLASTTTEDFAYINRLAIDSKNANIVIAATETGIMKSIDGGTTWTKVYSSSTGIEDLKADPVNFNKLYATENGIGVVLSTNAGDDWALSINGLEQGSRYELAISPVNTAKIYLSVNNTTPAAYRSTDSGATWKKFKNTDDTEVDFLGQGNYDNIITAHPYNENVAFLGGVNLWKVDFSDPGTTTQSDPYIYRVQLNNTESFLDFINFGGTYLSGGMETGDNNNAIGLVNTDWVSVEIRFGSGMSQKAHRFTVGGVGSGVPSASYIYKDYVDVPFEVWDITNNRQLMASFRDQEEDDVFNLIARDPSDDTKGREYLFVNAITYSETASTDIAKDGGHSYKQLYFFWPTLAEAGTWDDTNLPASKITINYGTISETTGTRTMVSNAYSYEANNYDQVAGYGKTSIPGLHPDHHNLVMIKTDIANEKFIVINANDGGLAISENEGLTFTQLPNNYITTQFYGVAKRSGVNEYIGGMQDNGTWATPSGENSSETTDFIFHIGGDGFECVWHPEDANKIIGSVYYNSFRRSLNGGNSWPWAGASSGIKTVTSFGETRLDGPFISRISYHKNNPDVLFAVGYNGIYKSTDFAGSWSQTILGTGWNSKSNIDNFHTTSQHNIEVSLANENIVWTGAALNSANSWSIFVSTDQGATYNTVTDYDLTDLSGFISGIATHPYEDSTAYLLFSLPGEPKVLRTKNLGQTWEDISGFNRNSSSSNGFPDVVVHSLVVMPHDPSIIWVGTDIGIFESTDNGETWNYLISDLPAVSVYDMFVQDGQVVIATHGRGIWSAGIEEIYNIPILSQISRNENTLSSESDYKIAFDTVQFYINDNLYTTYETPSIGRNTLNYDYSENSIFKFHIIGYFNNKSYHSNIVRIDLSSVNIDSYTNKISNLKVYPNPSNGYITIELPESFNKNYIINVYSLSGAKVYSTKVNKSDSRINLENLKDGLYVIKLENNGEVCTQKIQIRK